MLELELLSYYKKMCERNIILDFQGAMSQDMLVGMAELIKNKSSANTDKSFLTKKVFSVFIEMAQNIALYSVDRVDLGDNSYENGVGTGIIVVAEKENIFTITSGNLVRRADESSITQHIDRINQMDREELKQFYKQRIKSARQSGRRGAGVGFIDMARRSGNEIQYQVTPVDDLNSFLVFSVKVQEENNNG